MKDDAHLIEAQVTTHEVFAGNMLRVRRDDVRLPDGNAATREFVVHPGAALVVPVLPDGRLVLERQYRYPIGRVILEFPAGKIDAGEEPFATAQRELLEEVGYTSETWRPLGIIHPQVGYSNEVITMFEARDLVHVGARLDEGEILEAVSMTEGEVLAAFDRGELTDSKTIAALLAWQRRR